MKKLSKLPGHFVNQRKAMDAKPWDFQATDGCRWSPPSLRCAHFFAPSRSLFLLWFGSDLRIPSSRGFATGRFRAELLVDGPDDRPDFGP